MNSFKDQPSQLLSLPDDIFQIASHHHDMGAVRSKFLKLVKRTIAFRRGALYLLNEEDEFQLQETDPTDDQGFGWVDHLIEDGIIDWLILEKKVRPIPYPKGIKRDHERLIVPLIVRGKGFGFLAVEGTFQTDPQKEEKLNLIVCLGSVVGVTLENQILTEKVDERRHRLDVLERISQKLLLITDLNRLLTFILDYAQEVVPSQEATLAWSEDGGDAFIVRNRQEGSAKQSRDHLTEIEKWVIDRGNPLMLNDYTHDIRFREAEKAFPFPLRQVLSTPIPSKNKAPGALSLFNRLEGQGYTNQDLIFLSTLASHAAVAIEIATLYRNMKQAYKETIRALANAIEAKDPYTRGHTERVTSYALQMADSLGIESEEKEILEYASLLHDVGKIGISGKILRKKGPLNKEEYLQIKKHPIIGEDIVKDVRFLDRARFLIRHHHERYDGQGYPDGLDGQSMLLSAHILILADALDAMCSNRPYREALPQEKIQNEILKNAGKQFHPDVTDQALNLFFGNGEDEYAGPKSSPSEERSEHESRF